MAFLTPCAARRPAPVPAVALAVVLAGVPVAAAGLGSAVASAGEPVLGRVLSVGPDAVELEVQDGGGNRLRIPLSGSEGSGALAPGTLVRVWPGPEGERSGEARQSGAGARLEVLGPGAPGRDLTGVRSRLGRGAALGRGAGSFGSRGVAGGRGGR